MFSLSRFSPREAERLSKIRYELTERNGGSRRNSLQFQGRKT